MTPIHDAEVTILNRLGLHARPAAMFVRIANRYRSDVYVNRDGVEINGKSIMGVMMLTAEQGATIRIRAEGEDAEQAVHELVGLVERGFDEDDEGRPVAGASRASSG